MIDGKMRFFLLSTMIISLVNTGIDHSKYYDQVFANIGVSEEKLEQMLQGIICGFVLKTYSRWRMCYHNHLSRIYFACLQPA